MEYYLYSSPGDFGTQCAALCLSKGLIQVDKPNCDLAIAPYLRKKLPKRELSKPRLGTLIFHPSILPYHRGPDAIKWAVYSCERVSGITWFWADEDYDAGPVCEQEPVLLAPPEMGESPGRAYYTRFIPAGLRALDRALTGILSGNPRRVPQDEALASMESLWMGH